jgi:hypothetical protein
MMGWERKCENVRREGSSEIVVSSTSVLVQFTVKQPAPPPSGKTRRSLRKPKTANAIDRAESSERPSGVLTYAALKIVIRR